MKTKHIKITNRIVRQLQCILAVSITWLLPLLVLILTIESSRADDFTWISDESHRWNNGFNWDLETFPNGPDDTAIFDTDFSSVTDVFIGPFEGESVAIEVNGIVFNPGASPSPFTIGVGPNSTLSISGVGITNNSGITQNFVTSGGTTEGEFRFRSGVIVFSNSATAGSNVTITNNGGVGRFGTGGITAFLNTSTADKATITNNGGTKGGSGGITGFLNTSTADNATITNNGGTGGGTGGITAFFNTSTAGNATLIANGGSGGGLGGSILFEDDSTGGTARVEIFGNGNLDISGHSAPGVTVGSIEGNGNVVLGANNLTVGSRNLPSTLFSGVISGLGGLTKVGTGTQILSGENTYTGPTIVDAGSLLVDGSIGTGLTSVNADGLLGGGGLIGGSVLNSGTVSPGNSPGTLTIDGDYTQTKSGTLLIEVAGLGPTEHDLLVVNGTATLAGTLNVIRLNGFHFLPGEQITLLTAGVALKGKFKPVENAFITGTIVESHIVYDRLSEPKSVILNLTQGSFAAVCSTPNDIAVGTALDSAVGDPRAAGLIEFLDTVPLSELCDDLGLIAPPDIASIFNIGVSLANIQTANLERRMDDIRAGSRGFSASGFTINGSTPNFSGGLAGPTGPEGKSGPSVMQPTAENRWGVFVTGLGEFTNIGDTSNARGFDLTTGGFTLGVDYRMGSNFAIGLTGGYVHTNADLANNGNLGVNGGTIGLYATAFGGGFYVNAAATGGFNSYDTDRTALLGSAKGSTDGADFTALLAGGYDWKIGGLSIGPVANFQYTYVSFDSFTESGSLAPLEFNNQNADSIRTSVGLKTSYDWKVGSVVVRPEIRAAWQHEFGDSEYSIVSRFANGAGSSFTVNGPAIGRDSLLIGAGAAVLLNDRVAIYAYYDGELARTNYSSNNVSAGVRVTF